MQEENVSVRERIAAAFETLRSIGWFTAQDYMCCMTCGFADADEFERERVKRGQFPLFGIAFYHGQDAESLTSGGALKRGRVLGIAFDGRKGSRAGVARRRADAGHILMTVLLSEGLDVVWSGNPFDRVRVTGTLTGD